MIRALIVPEGVRASGTALAARLGHPFETGCTVGPGDCAAALVGPTARGTSTTLSSMMAPQFPRGSPPPPHEDRRIVAPADPPPSAPPRVVLVVDDDAALRDLIAEVLRDVQGETAPVRLVTAADGVEALAVLDAAPPDLIVLDLRMPGLDGFAFCRRVRAEPRFRSIPLIVLTALGPSDEVRRRALDAGCDAFLAKPFDLDDLADVIAHWLRVSAANRPT